MGLSLSCWLQVTMRVLEMEGLWSTLCKLSGHRSSTLGSCPAVAQSRREAWVAVTQQRAQKGRGSRATVPLGYWAEGQFHSLHTSGANPWSKGWVVRPLELSADRATLLCWPRLAGHFEGHRIPAVVTPWLAVVPGCPPWGGDSRAQESQSSLRGRRSQAG